MSHSLRISALALAVSAGWVLPAQAQSQTRSTDTLTIQQELAAMRAQIGQLENRVDTLEGEVEQEKARADAAEAKVAATAPAPTPASAPVVAAAAPAQVAAAKPALEVTWDGAPKITADGGWSFKPRGRLQIDAAGVNAPSGIASSDSLGFGTEVRRAYLGVDGTLPGGFGYRVEADFAPSSVEVTDAYLNYKATKDITLTVGHQKPFWGLEEMTSDLFTSFMERAAFNSAFGFERRVGASAAYSSKLVVVQGGVFTDSMQDLGDDTNNSRSFDGRIVFMPKIGSGQLHVGGSMHFRDFNDASSSTRYRARPFAHTTDVRLIDTGNFSATGENSLGAELAYIDGRFHATAESHWITALRPDLANPTFNGGYAEVGYLLTDDKTGYKGGAFDRIRPSNPVDKGGLGAFQINARYDWLSLNDAGIVGGRQQVAGASLLWIPTDYVRFVLNYGHLWIKDSPVPAGTDTNYQADTMGIRAQVDF